MPKRVEEVRFMIERLRLNDEGESASTLLSRFCLGMRWFGSASSGDGLDDEVSGGVGLLRFKSKGLRGIGRRSGGLFDDMLLDRQDGNVKLGEASHAILLEPVGRC